MDEWDKFYLILVGSILGGLFLVFGPLLTLFMYWVGTEEERYRILVRLGLKPSVEYACNLMDHNLPRLANPTSFDRLVNRYEDRHEVHAHLFQKAISLFEKAVTRTGTANMSTIIAMPNADEASDCEDHYLQLLRSVIQNTFPRFEERARATRIFDKWEEVAREIARCDLWDQRGMVLAWFKAGLPFMDSFQSYLDWKNDEEIWLLKAENCKPTHQKVQKFLSSLDGNLKGRKEFMIEVVKRDPSLLPLACSPLCGPGWWDLDLVTHAFASDPTYTSVFVIMMKRHRERLIRARDQLQRKLNALAALSRFDFHVPLDHHHLILKEIHDYLGVCPDKDDITVLQRAEMNVSYYLRNMRRLESIYLGPGVTVIQRTD